MTNLTIQSMQIMQAHPGMKVTVTWSDGSLMVHTFPYADKRTSKRELKEWCESARRMESN